MSRIGHSLAVCVASLLLLTVVAQIPSDYDCGTPLVALSATQPNVLLVGDSISMVPPYTPGGYGEATRTLLAAQSVTAQHAGGTLSSHASLYPCFGDCVSARNFWGP